MDCSFHFDHHLGGSFGSLHLSSLGCRGTSSPMQPSLHPPDVNRHGDYDLALVLLVKPQQPSLHPPDVHRHGDYDWALGFIFPFFCSKVLGVLGF